MLLVYFLTFRAPSQILLIDALWRLLDCLASNAFNWSSLIGGVNLPFWCSEISDFLIDWALVASVSEILVSLERASLVRICLIKVSIC